MNNSDDYYDPSMNIPDPSLYIDTPVVKSHNIPPIGNYPLQQQTMETTNMMEIDDFFMPSNSMFMYSPLSTSITTNNSSIMMMDTAINPIDFQSIDPFVPSMFPEPPVVPTNVPRRHTVSLPYLNIVDSLPPPPPKSRKSSLKAKRHRSLSKLNDPSSLENWTHEQLLERVKELEKEKEQNKILSRSSSRRSASQTDTEVEDDDDDEAVDGPHVCKWDTCTLEYNTLSHLISHVKLDHIGSGKKSYYCCWKDCVRNQKPFTKKHKMHNHLRTHTGERPFACEEPDCGKRFSRLDSLATHAKIHSNVRPYLCECGKAYYHLRSLRKHEKSHMDPPPLPVAPQTDWGLSAQAAVFDVMDQIQY